MASKVPTIDTTNYAQLQLRQIALDLAVKAYDSNSGRPLPTSEVVSRATDYYNFLKG